MLAVQVVRAIEDMSRSNLRSEEEQYGTDIDLLLLSEEGASR